MPEWSLWVLDGVLAIVITLLGVGGFAVHVVEFHIPASIAEALPRL